MKGLKDRCARVEAAVSTDQAERYECARVHRYLRHRALSDVEGLLELRGPLELTAGVMAALQPYEAELFEEARASEQRELPDALAFDTMSRMADQSAAARFVECPSRAPATVVAHVDHTAFTRGHTVAGEVCEIVGVGPIPVAVARRLADDAFLKALIHDGTDILAVSHLGRSIPSRLRTAVEELYPECALQGCHANRHLEIDHNIPVAEGGLTEIGNLAGCATSITRTSTRTTCASPALERTNASSPSSDRGVTRDPIAAQELVSAPPRIVLQGCRPCGQQEQGIRGLNMQTLQRHATLGLGVLVVTALALSAGMTNAGAIWRHDARAVTGRPSFRSGDLRIARQRHRLPVRQEARPEHLRDP